MNICPKYHGFCDSFGAVQCGGDCAKCKDAKLANAMTLGELIAAFETFMEKRYHARRSTRQALLKMMSVLGLTENDKMTRLDENAIRTFYDTATDIEPVSRKSYLDAIYRFNMDSFRAYCETKGCTIASIPRVKGLSGRYDRYEAISEDSMKRLRDLQFAYRNLSDPRKWLMLTLGLDFGLSKIDVLSAKWDSQFTVQDGQVISQYVRHKTGKTAMWKVSDEQWREFQRARMLAEELAVKGMSADTKGFVVRHPFDENSKNHQSDIWNAMNVELRSTVPEWKDDPKAAHNTRKEFATRICRDYGWDVAEIATGDTQEMLRKSYVGKFKIDWRNIK